MLVSVEFAPTVAEISARGLFDPHRSWPAIRPRNVGCTGLGHAIRCDLRGTLSLKAQPTDQAAQQTGTDNHFDHGACAPKRQQGQPCDEYRLIT